MSYYSGPLGHLGADMALEELVTKDKQASANSAVALTADGKPQPTPEEKKSDASLFSEVKPDSELVVTAKPGTEAVVMPSDLLAPTTFMEPAPSQPILVNNQNVSPGLFGIPWLYVGVGAVVIGGGAWYMLRSDTAPTANRRRARKNARRAKRVSRSVR